jgi:hypothetical protein
VSHFGDNPQAFAAYVVSLGGSLVDEETFSFPLNKLAEAIPKISELGVDVRKVNEYTGTNPRNGRVEGVAVFRASKRPDPAEAPLKGSYSGRSI